MLSKILTKWQVGDCFITKINSTKYPEFNDKFLIIIVSGHYQYNSRIYPTAYLKLSNKEVKTQQDIDNAEFIIYDQFLGVGDIFHILD